MDSYGPESERDRKVLTVAQLNREARRLLETGLAMVRVEGELSNIARPASGHWYFTLKDQSAQIRCAMFKTRNRYVQLELREGQAVIVRGKVSLYEARGDYQLIVENMQDAGVGALQKKFEALRRQLEAEGLFAPERKRPLPQLPRRIGVVTSPTGAVIRDILHVLARRFPGVPVRIYPTAVQGDQAADQIVAALANAGRRRDCDVLILARGGGSLEDLWPFNDERVARALHRCKIPVISAVGHETDVTISDFVADMRAPTPTAAASMAVPDRQTWLDRLSSLSSRLQRAIVSVLAKRGEQWRWLAGRHRQVHPQLRIAQYAQRVDELDLRLAALMRLYLGRRREKLLAAGARLQSLSPQQTLLRAQNRLDVLSTRIIKAMGRFLEERRTRLLIAGTTLGNVGPQATLERGYAIVRCQQKIITAAADLQRGAPLDIRMARGSVHATVDAIETNVKNDE
ncbi:MAG: exodeoxyribonuclease VII large subunit [Gammaproteobacteria bacterium]|nr:exodeoxyribonuclease VII large subunit [Gammaproteobacteria bacterium]